MARLSARELSRVTDLTAPLRVVEEGTPSPLGALLPELGALVGLPKVASYGVSVEEETYGLEFLHAHGFGRPVAALEETWEQALRTGGRSVGFYTPARPERSQQNVAVALPVAASLSRPGTTLPRAVTADASSPRWESAAQSAAMVAFQRMGIDGQHQLRALVCEGDALLAWVGGFRDEPFTDRERLLLQAFVPPLRKRLALERLIGSARLNSATVEALLEQMPVPAALVSPGKIHHVNSAARSLLEADPVALRQAVAGALQGQPTAQLTRIEAGSHGTRYLATFPPRVDPRAQSARARQRWGLTDRQGEVLLRMAGGESNKAIAATLDCAERTIEAHVTQVLNKLSVESRSAAVARFWSELR